MTIDHDDPRVQAALRFLGVPYVAGAGAPRDAARDAVHILSDGVMNPQHPGVRGWDCSGAALAYSVTVGDIEPTMGDMRAHDIANACDEVLPANVRAGDFAFYDRDGDRNVEHVAICVGGGMVVSMSGGTLQTFGTNPAACGKCIPVGAPLCYGRWKKRHLRTP